MAISSAILDRLKDVKSSPKYIARLTMMDRMSYDEHLSNAPYNRRGEREYWGNPAQETLVKQWDSTKPRIGWDDKEVFEEVAWIFDSFSGAKRIWMLPRYSSPRLFLRYYLRTEIDTCKAADPFCVVEPASEWACFAYDLL